MALPNSFVLEVPTSGPSWPLSLITACVTDAAVQELQATKGETNKRGAAAAGEKSFVKMRNRNGACLSSGGVVLEKQQDAEAALMICETLHAGKAFLRTGLDARLLDEWCGKVNEAMVAIASGSQSPAATSKLLGLMNNRLSWRTFFVGHSLSLADIFCVAFVAKTACSGTPPTTLNKSIVGKYKHVARWWSLMQSVPAIVRGLALSFGDAAEPEGTSSANRQPTGSGSSRQSADSNVPKLVLPGAEVGKVVTRFPPEPSGYLHIGHVKAAMLNAHFAKQYEGKLIVRFDDTNPSKEKSEFQDAILEDLASLGIQPDMQSHTSDHFPVLQKYMTAFIEQGKAYVDKTPMLQMRDERGAGIESQYRNQNVEENLRLWDEMLKGSEEGRLCVVRAKMDMQSNNKCMRDPTFYRCNVDTPHHRTGTQYKAYPIYDFACPIVDSLEGVTHAMRSNEYSDRVPQYHWVIEQAGLRPVNIYEFSRLNFVNTVLSKRKLSWIVDNGKVEGWDDPRFPTVRGMRRLGLRVDALNDFLIEQGGSKNTNLMDWSALWNKNKQRIDPIAPRYMAVGKEGAVRVSLQGAPTTPEQKERPLHPKNPEVGVCQQWFYQTILIEQEDAKLLKEGEEITLVRWGNAFVDSISTVVDETTGEQVVREIKGRLHLEGDFKKTKSKIHWVPLCNEGDLQKDGDSQRAASEQGGNEEKLTVCTLQEYDLLIKKRKPEENDDIADIFNENSRFVTTGLADPLIRKLCKGDVIQFERRGFFIVDQPFDKVTCGIPVLNKIPDGKTKAMSVISTKVDLKTLAKGKSET